MWRIYGGAIAVIAGIAAFIEARSHRPFVFVCPPGNICGVSARKDLATFPRPPTTYSASVGGR